MPLISNASNPITKGINELTSVLYAGYTKPSQKGSNTSALGAMYDKLKNDIAKGKETAGGFFAPTVYASGPDQTGGNNNSNNNNNNSGVWQGPVALNVPAKNSGSGSGSSSNSNDSKILASIGQGWDDTGDVIKSTSKSLDTSKNYINNLGKVRDQYLTALKGYKDKTDQAIAGNKTLIEQNQKKDLDTLAADTRKSMDNTNVMLGIKGASGGSASKAAARAIAESAGKQRASVLTGYGDQTSAQNQAAQDALDDFNLKTEQAYEWEKTARQQALDDYNEEKDALDRLKNKSSGWKDADIKAMSDKNLSKLLSGLSDIQNKAANFRVNLAAKMVEYGGLADALDTAAVTVDTPAELDTPKFNENIDMTDPSNSEDWYDPNNTGKKIKVKTRDAAGNPIAYEDAAGNEVDENGNPVGA